MAVLVPIVQLLFIMLNFLHVRVYHSLILLSDVSVFLQFELNLRKVAFDKLQGLVELTDFDIFSVEEVFHAF